MKTTGETKTCHQSVGIQCERCSRWFRSLKGYNVHVYNNRMCNLAPLCIADQISGNFSNKGNNIYGNLRTNENYVEEDGDTSDNIVIQSNNSTYRHVTFLIMNTLHLNTTHNSNFSHMS